jgi:dTMP kinase
MDTAPKHPAQGGKLIAVEGIDGVGKSTQVKLLERWLASQGLLVFHSEWASSELVKGATRRGRKQRLFTPTTFCLLHATDLVDRYERQILPMLQAGFVVLCDRYIYTSLARDAVRGCDPAWLRALFAFAHVPDLTIYLDLPLHLALERAEVSRVAPDHFESGMDLGLSSDPHESLRLFQSRVQEQFLGMSTEFGFVVVDATASIHDQQAIIRRHVAERIDLSHHTDRRRR